MQVTKIYTQTTAKVRLEDGKEITVGELLNSFEWDTLLSLVTGKPIEVTEVDTYTVSFNVLLNGIDLVSCKVERPPTLTLEDISQYLRRVTTRVNLATKHN